MDHSLAKHDSGPSGEARSAGNSPFPLSTRGRYIVDRRGNRFKLKAVNWYGASDRLEVVGGLDRQPLPAIVRLIKAMGFNAVRLPFSNRMLHSPQVSGAWSIRANPDLLGHKTPLDVYDEVVRALTDAGIAVILNNHTTTSTWCCGWDENALWSSSQTTEQWQADWMMMCKRYRSNKGVVGADLRNEVRPKGFRSPNWGKGDERDWHQAAREMGNRILSEANPDLLVVVEGIAWWGMPNLGGERPQLKPVRNKPIRLIKPDKLVYSVHNYGHLGPRHTGAGITAFHTRYNEMPKSVFEKTMEQEWGYVVTPGQPYTAPVWLSEFGIAYDEPDEKYRKWFEHLVGYLVARDIDWSYWPLNSGPKPGKAEEEKFGLLAEDWSAPRDDWRGQILSKLIE